MIQYPTVQMTAFHNSELAQAPVVGCLEDIKIQNMEKSRCDYRRHQELRDGKTGRICYKLTGGTVRQLVHNARLQVDIKLGPPY